MKAFAENELIKFIFFKTFQNNSLLKTLFLNNKILFQLIRIYLRLSENLNIKNEDQFNSIVTLNTADGSIKYNKFKLFCIYSFLP